MDRLRAMELFFSVSQTKSFSETARQFGISATAVSRAVTEFEGTLNVKLLLRSTRQVVLTESGQEYAEKLEEAPVRLFQGFLRRHRRVRLQARD